MKPPRFTYHRPETLEEALFTLSELGDEAKLLAGGQSLVPMLNLRITNFDHLIDIGRVGELTTFQRRDGELVVGAGVRDRVIELDPSIADAVPLLHKVTPFIGHFQIRNRGTIGGSMAHADPAAEYPSVAIALGAELELVSTRGARRVSAADYFTGFWSTDTKADELLTSISFPSWGEHRGFGVSEFARRHGDFAVAGAVAAIEVDDAGSITRSAVTAFGVSDTPVALAAAALVGTAAAATDADDLAAQAVLELDNISDDPQVPAAYRRRVAAAVIADAWRLAITDLERTSR